MISVATRSTTRLLALLSLSMILCATNGYCMVETGGVYGQWGVWSGWYWPFNETLPPNLYGAGEALSRYDTVAGANSRTWEHDYHGPGLNQQDWGGHCHAWSGASVWESMPVGSRVWGGVTFRARDLAGLLTECYYRDTQATEISVYRPSPGLLWRYLRQEVRGDDPMHGHAMAIIGNLTQYPGEVWNFPIYQYSVVCTQDGGGDTYSGALTLWFADDGSPSYADSLGLSSASTVYRFTGVSFDANLAPRDSGTWAGNEPSQYPTSIWRPYYASSWTNYVSNPELDASYLDQILDMLGLGVALNATSLKWVTGGDANWLAETTRSHDLSSAAQSGRIGNKQSSWLQTTVTGPGTISFWWKVSSEVGFDFLKFLVDGQEKGSISGEVDWQSRSYALAEPGSHTLLWIYAKDAADTAGSDCAWLDQVSWVSTPTPDAPALTVTRDADHVVISWATNWPNYQLESCTSTVPPQVWGPVAIVPSAAGSLYTVTNALAPDCVLYRLRLP
jgi:hypothetical protein